MCFYQHYIVQAQAVSPYETSLEDELQLQVGDIIKEIHMNDGSYWTGYLKGRRGHFPKDHVELLSEGKCYTLISKYSDKAWRLKLFLANLQYDYY